MQPNDGSRIIGVIDRRVRKLTGSEAGVETTWGEVCDVSADGRFASAYLYGETVYPSENFRIPGSLMVTVGDRVKVAWDARGDRWVTEVANLSAYKKIEVDANAGTIKVGDGTARPTILIADSSGAVVGTHDHDADYAALVHNHDADYSDIVHDHDADYSGISHNHDASYSATGHEHDADYAPLLRSFARYERATSSQSISNNSETTAIYNETVDNGVTNSDWSYDTSTGIWTINNSGWYFISAGWLWSASTGGGNRQLSIQIAGTQRAADRKAVTTASQTVAQNVSTLFYIEATETMQIRLRQESGAALGNNTGADSQRTYVAVARLG